MATKNRASESGGTHESASDELRVPKEEEGMFVG